MLGMRDEAVVQGLLEGDRCWPTGWILDLTLLGWL